MTKDRTEFLSVYHVTLMSGQELHFAAENEEHAREQASNFDETDPVEFVQSEMCPTCGGSYGKPDRPCTDFGSVYNRDWHPHFGFSELRARSS